MFYSRYKTCFCFRGFTVVFSATTGKKQKKEEEEEGMFCNTFVLMLSGLHLMTVTLQSQEDKGKHEEGSKQEVKQAPVSHFAGAFFSDPLKNI